MTKWQRCIAFVVSGMLLLVLAFQTLKVALIPLILESRLPDTIDLPPTTIVGGVVLVLIFLALAAAKGQETAASTDHGSATFADVEDIEDILYDMRTRSLRSGGRLSGPEIIDELPPGFVALGKHRDKHVVVGPQETIRHGYIVGATGWGKSRKFVMQNCAATHGSFIANDSKGELWAATSGYHDGTLREDPRNPARQVRAQAVRYAPSDPDHSASFNPVPLCGNSGFARQMAGVLLAPEFGATTQDYYAANETNLLSAILVYVAESTAPTLVSVHNLLGLAPADLLTLLQRSPSRLPQRVATAALAIEERYSTSMIEAIQTKLEWLDDPNIRRFTSASLDAPDFARLKQEPVAVYLCITPDDMEQYPQLLALFWTVVMRQLGGPAGPIPVMLLLDEFGNLAPIPGFVTRHTLARDRGVGIWLAFQDPAMLETRYTRAEVRTILNGSSTKLVLPGLAWEAAEEVSAALGSATIRRVTTTSADGGKGRGSTTETVGEHGRPLMTADEVRRMPEGQILAIIGNRRPLLLDAVIYDRPPLAATTTPLGEEIGQDYAPHIGIGSRRSPGRRGAATPPPSPPRFSLDDEEDIATNSSSEGE